MQTTIFKTNAAINDSAIFIGCLLFYLILCAVPAKASIWAEQSEIESYQQNLTNWNQGLVALKQKDGAIKYIKYKSASFAWWFDVHILAGHHPKVSHPKLIIAQNVCNSFLTFANSHKEQGTTFLMYSGEPMELLTNRDLYLNVVLLRDSLLHMGYAIDTCTNALGELTGSGKPRDTTIGKIEAAVTAYSHAWGQYVSSMDDITSINDNYQIMTALKIQKDGVLNDAIYDYFNREHISRKQLSPGPTLATDWKSIFQYILSAKVVSVNAYSLNFRQLCYVAFTTILFAVNKTRFLIIWVLKKLFIYKRGVEKK